MKGIATEKVPGGKLVRIKVDFNSAINKIEITGDFFVHPEEGIFEIEKALTGIDASSSQESIAEIVQRIIQEKNFSLIGFDAEAIGRIVVQAIANKIV